MSFLTECSNWFNCEDGKKSKDIPWGSFWKWLITDSNGCPAVRVKGALTAEVTASISTPANSEVGDALIEGADNAELLANIIAWRVANPSFKQISIVNANSISAQAVIISYTT